MRGKGEASEWREAECGFSLEVVCGRRGSGEAPPKRETLSNFYVSFYWVLRK